MTMQQTKPMKVLREPIIPRSWKEDRSLSLGGAGASLATLLTTLQIAASNSGKAEGTYTLPMAGAAMAMAFWICLWLVGDTDAYWRNKFPDKAKKTPLTRVWGPVLFSIAIAFLGLAIGSLIATASTRAAWMFAVAAGLATILALKHSSEVRKCMRGAVAVPRKVRKRK